ncbi:MAG: ATP-grasp domain-containing protein [Planctomycetes bacterium]|nr:ATP-grasp domain-containing protein [Planctomycetota bacterium]
MPMNVVFLSPGFPAEMPYFTRGLAQVGAKVFGVGDQPAAALAPEARESLTDYLQVRNLGDEDGVVQQVTQWLRGRSVDRVESLWETQMLLAARLRETFRVPGMTVAQTVPFRDKEAMKQVVERAGLRVPHHGRARTSAEAWAVVERVGYPAIVKPIAGAGSKDTWRCNDKDEFAAALQKTRHVDELSVEEYIDGEELTFDTVCAGGRMLYHNVAWYRPKPMILAQSPWISMQNICLRDTSIPMARPGVELGGKVLQALGFTDGFTHMEWFLTAKGEAVFGEIGARAAGARLVHAMNYASDLDLFRGWASATCHGHLGQEVNRKYNASMVFKRAQGDGIVRRYEGLQQLMAKYGQHVANLELTPIGQPKRDWKKVVVGDGWIVVRHPDLQFTLEMSERFVTDLRVVAE